LCECLNPQYKTRKWSELALHPEVQDTNCDAWKRLLDLVELAARDGSEEFAPRREMPPEDWEQIVTLPPSIAKLKNVKHLMLYESYLVRIPPEIGAMTALKEFTPYTSYRLHYFPYEITRCLELKESTVSTRALYGNQDYRPPFPRLPAISPGGSARTLQRVRRCVCGVRAAAILDLAVGRDGCAAIAGACLLGCLCWPAAAACQTTRCGSAPGRLGDQAPGALVFAVRTRGGDGWTVRDDRVGLKKD